jgi:ADP-ribosyl-[dinitrogen reductase] hydrolase
MMPDLEDRYVGCLVGLAVGDALGAPLEFMGPEQIRIKHGLVSEMIGGGWQGLRPGETTDETAMARTLGESLVERGDLDLEDVAVRYRAWLRGSPREVEPITRAALEALDEGYPPAEAAARAMELTSDQVASNGALVRAVPLALLYRRDPEVLLSRAAEEAALTHADPRCGGAAAALAAVIVGILAGETDRGAVLDAAFDALERMPEGIPNVLPDAASKRSTALRPSRFVIDTLETALVEWFRAPDLDTCLVRTVNHGVESAATGAVAGALAGATWGAGAIPRRWARAVQDRKTLVRIAGSLLERSERTDR